MRHLRLVDATYTLVKKRLVICECPFQVICVAETGGDQFVVRVDLPFDSAQIVPCMKNTAPFPPGQISYRKGVLLPGICPYTEKCPETCPFVICNVLRTVFVCVARYICKCVSQVPVSVEGLDTDVGFAKGRDFSIFIAEDHGIGAFHLFAKSMCIGIFFGENSNVRMIGNHGIYYYDYILAPCTYCQNLYQTVAVIIVPADYVPFQPFKTDMEGKYPAGSSVGHFPNHSFYETHQFRFVGNAPIRNMDVSPNEIGRCFTPR